MSPGLDHESIWSSANFSGNTAGCLLPFFPVLCIVHVLYRTPNSLTLRLLCPTFRLVVPSACLTVPCTAVPAHLFGLSSIRFTVLGLPFDRMNIYSKAS